MTYVYERTEKELQRNTYNEIYSGNSLNDSLDNWRILLMTDRHYFYWMPWSEYRADQQMLILMNETPSQSIMPMWCTLLTQHSCVMLSYLLQSVEL